MFQVKCRQLISNERKNSKIQIWAVQLYLLIIKCNGENATADNQKSFRKIAKTTFIVVSYYQYYAPRIYTGFYRFDDRGAFVAIIRHINWFANYSETFVFIRGLPCTTRIDFKVFFFLGTYVCTKTIVDYKNIIFANRPSGLGGEALQTLHQRFYII